VAKMLNDPVVFQEWPHCNQGTSNENLEQANAQKTKEGQREA